MLPWNMGQKMREVGSSFLGSENRPMIDGFSLVGEEVTRAGGELE